MDISSKDQENYHSLFRFAQDTFMSWKDLQFEDVKFTRLAGCSNFVYKIEVITKKELQPCVIVSKVFGSSASIFVNRALENQALQSLSIQGICPRVFAINDKMRLEEYIPNISLEYEDYLDDDKALKVFEQLAHLHSTKLDIKFTTPYIKGFASWENPLITKALKDVKKTFKMKEDQEKRLDIILEYFNDEKVDSIISLIDKLNYKFVKFCHNDLFYKNLLLGLDNRMYIIDFEYGDYNYITYDIANLVEQFVFEFPDECDPPFFRKHEENLPSDKRLAIFLNHYLKEFLKSPNITEEERKEFTMIEMNKFIQDIKLSRVLCTFQWTIWSILMFGNPAGGADDFIDFAYNIYGLHLNAMKEWLKSLE